MKKRIGTIKPAEVRADVEWLWKNRDRGGCCHHVLWVEPYCLDDEEEENPHAGREWSRRERGPKEKHGSK